jgi:hypothetical protein
MSDEAAKDKGQDKDSEKEPVSVRGRAVTAMLELAKILTLPLVTLVLGYWFNSSLNERQALDTNSRLYAEMMGRREEADSNLRKDMFNSILATFMAKDPNGKVSSEELIRQQILSLELLAANFNDSLDIGPLFKDVQRRIALEERKTNVELRARLESVAQQVIEHQLTVVSDVGSVERGFTVPAKIKDLSAHFMNFGSRALNDPAVKPGEGVSRLCLSMQAPDETRHYRQFTIDPIEANEAVREVKIHLYVSKLLTEEDCKNAALDLVAKQEVDTNFQVGLFDFPLIDNTRLSSSERVTVSVTDMNADVLGVAIAYFPASRASLKDKPYYDELITQLVRPGRPKSSTTPVEK